MRLTEGVNTIANTFKSSKRSTGWCSPFSCYSENCSRGFCRGSLDRLSIVPYVSLKNSEQGNRDHCELENANNFPAFSLDGGSLPSGRAVSDGGGACSGAVRTVTREHHPAAQSQGQVV